MFGEDTHDTGGNFVVVVAFDHNVGSKLLAVEEGSIQTSQVFSENFTLYNNHTIVVNKI